MAGLSAAVVQVNPEVDSRYAWLRLLVTALIGTIGGVGMWSIVVVLPAVQADFGVPRADAALAYTMTMAGFALGGVLMGRMIDRFGVARPLAGAVVMLGLGYGAAATAGSLWQFALAQGVLIGFLGSSIVFGPLIADASRWFLRRRGLAVSICASSNYLAGVVWPPVMQHAITAWGWRAAYAGIGVFCVVTMLPLMLLLRRRPPALVSGRAGNLPDGIGPRSLGLAPNTLTALLVLAGVCCCVAMSMPQVHLVAYCGDLGYGTARGTEMLSLMLGCGIVSRLLSGWIADRIGGLATLLLGSVLQGVALFLYLWFDGLTSLFVISALFGLFQGGIVPSYAIVVREYFPASEAGTRTGIVLMSTLGGMAFGGWLSGVVFDASGSYQAAFANGLAWNLVNVTVVGWLLLRGIRASRPAMA